MVLKGGIAYLDMRGSDINTVTESSAAIFVKDLYRDAVKVVKSKKICVLYNAGSPYLDVPIVITGYNTVGNTIVMRYFMVASSGSISSKRIIIRPDSYYYVQLA